MRKIFDNWCYNFNSCVGYLFYINFLFGVLGVFFALNFSFFIFCFYVCVYVLIIGPIFVAKARDIFLKEMDLYVD